MEKDEAKQIIIDSAFSYAEEYEDADTTAALEVLWPGERPTWRQVKQVFVHPETKRMADSLRESKNGRL